MAEAPEKLEVTLRFPQLTEILKFLREERDLAPEAWERLGRLLGSALPAHLAALQRLASVGATPEEMQALLKQVQDLKAQVENALPMPTGMPMTGKRQRRRRSGTLPMDPLH